MKTLIKNSILSAICCLLSSAFLYGAFAPIPIGARPAGLGGAYTALADDVYSIYYNPAGLAFLNSSEFTAQYSQMYVGLWDKSNLSYSFIGIGQPLGFESNYGTLGISWLSFSNGQAYKENSLAVSYGRSIIIGGEKKLSLGLNLKHLSIIYGEDDYTYNSVNNEGVATSLADTLFSKYGFNKSVITADIGIQYFLFQNYKIGLTLDNVTTPNLSLANDDISKLPLIYNLGLAHFGQDYNIGIEFMSRQVNNLNDSKVSIAGEKYFPFGIGLRSGLVIGNREMMNVTFGFGYKASGLQFDYALEYPLNGIRNTTGNHKISMILRFGRVVSLVSQDTEKLQQDLRTTQDELKTIKSENDELKAKLDGILNTPSPVVPKPPEQKKPGMQVPVVSKPGKVTVTLEKQYNDDFNNYRMDAEKLPFIDRLRSIKEIVNQYKAKKVDIGPAQDEYKALIVEQAAQESSYKNSMLYYKKMASKEIDKKTAIDILNKIIKKYEAYGINLNEARGELKKMQEK